MGGPTHPQTHRSISNLAALLKSMGRAREAEPLFRRMGEHAEATNGPHHEASMDALYNLATLLKAMGKFQDAEPLYRRLLASKEVMFGYQHHETLQTLNELVDILHVLGKKDAAESYCQQARDRRPNGWTSVGMPLCSVKSPCCVLVDD